MKNINYVINGILAIAVIILFVMQFSAKKESGVTKTFSLGGDSTSLLPIAYVNVDSLLLNYNYSKDLNERILQKQENSTANINQQARELEIEMQDFQKKVENNAFLTTQRAQERQQYLIKKRNDLQALNDKLTQELIAEQQKVSEQLRDTIVAQLNAFNQDRKYQVIFSNTSGDNILLAGDVYNITREFLTLLNKNYSPVGK